MADWKASPCSACGTYSPRLKHARPVRDLDVEFGESVMVAAVKVVAVVTVQIASSAHVQGLHKSRWAMDGVW